METMCIDLRKHFGRRYRVEYEESYAADRGEGARAHDPWLLIIPCRFGHIFPHGGNRLAASVDGHPNVAGVLRRLSCCKVHQEGDDGELTVVFDVADFDKVAQIMRPRRRRRLSEAHRAKLVEAGAKTRFGHGVQGDPGARRCEAEGPGDSEHILQQMALFDR